MYEVEVKVPADHDRVKRRLGRAGARSVGSTVRQEDTYYDAPDRDFATTDEALRVRVEKEVDDGSAAASLTYKGPRVEAASKTRMERETGVESGDDAAAILEALGFTPAATVHKTRTRFALDGYTVTLDDVDGLGEFVEVETTSEEVESARQGAYDVLDRVGLDPDDQITTSYLGLLLRE